MVSVWGAFFYVVFSQPSPAVPGYSQPEREYSETSRLIDSVDAIHISQEETPDFQEAEAESDQQQETERRFTKDPEDYPDIRDGDAIGYGEGVSVDDLLIDNGAFDN